MGRRRRSLAVLLVLVTVMLAASVGPELVRRWCRGRSGPPAAPGERIDMRSIDVNRADAPLLETLPGIGPALAGEMVRERERAGDFRSARDLERVRGIGPALARKVEPYLFFGP